MIYLDSMGHLYSDSNLKELYDFAVIKLKLKPNWNHLGNLFPHFDLTTRKKKDLAIIMGAIPVDVRNLVGIKECRSWFLQLVDEEKRKNNLFFYESKGLLGQRLNRIDFTKLSDRL